MAKNKDCVITDTSVCKWLNKPCEQCHVKGIKTDEDKEKVLEDFEVMLSLLPEDIDVLRGEMCQFCKKDQRKGAGYAIIDVAHNEPAHKKGMFFGLGKKVRQRIGSLLPLNITICRRCRRNLRMVDNIKWLSIVAFLGLAIGLLFIPDIATAVGYTNSPLPYVIVIAGGVVGYIAGKIFSTMYLKAKKKETYFNVFDIPVGAELSEAGWFTVQDNKEATRFVFSKKPFIGKIGEIKKEAAKDDDDFEQTSFLEH